jgi:thiol-disulfide isomerase/thioredoxin
VSWKYWALAAFLVAASSGVAASEPDRVKFDLQGADGMRHSNAELAKAKAAVLIFLGTDCPISNRYSPLLHRLETEYAPKHTVFLAVFSDPSEKNGDVAKHLQDFGLSMPGLLDPDASLAKQTGAKVTPEAVVLSNHGQVLYRGRIDDRYVDFGKTRNVVREQDLREAIDAVLAGRPVPHPATKAIGCAIPGLQP